MSQEPAEFDLPATVERLGIGGYRRHILLCAGTKCCTGSEGNEAWETLKRELLQHDTAGVCYRTKAACLRVCGHGPVAVVYPEGTWYGGITADRVPRLVEEHLLGGEPVVEWMIAKNPLPAHEPGDSM
ncbi:MAG: (2Fe-2S) ferredoxin domain-containing protein [Gemmataceae bacterium]|nr:(2Fe-2S) ferredoxin domain-containing protein [Gemmataceae bacterium]